MSETPENAISDDASKNKFVKIYLGSLGVAGLALIGATAAFGWGGYGYGGGVFLLLAGFGGMAGMAMQGGFGEAPCPKCQHPLKFQFTNTARIMQCESCKAWSHGTETMALVPDGHMADYPVFTTPLPEPLSWPKGQDGEICCPVCSAASSGFEKQEGRDAIGSAAAMVAPVSVQRVYSLEVPVCPEHKDGVALLVQGSDVSLGFRSRAYQLRFEALNA